MVILQRTGDLSSTTKITVGFSMIAGPLGCLLGWAILMQRAGQGPDFGWFLSHTLLFPGVVFLVPALAGLRFSLDMRPSQLADFATGLGILGALALAGQFAIDLGVGQLSASQAEMSTLFKRLSAAPIISLPFQFLGPIAFYTGLLILFLLLLRSRIIPVWVGIVGVTGILGIGGGALTGNTFVTLVGFFGLWTGFIPIGWHILRRQLSGG